MPAPRIFFDHIPKTGGSAIHELLLRQFGGGCVSPLQRYVPAGDALMRFHQLPVVSGHFRFRPREPLPKDRVALTLLREPVERALSFYYFCRNDAVLLPGEPEERLRPPRELSLEEYVFSEDPRVLRWIANAQTHHFLNLARVPGRDLADDDKLALAKSSLDLYAGAGVYGRFDAFCDAIAEGAAGDKALKPRRVNATSARPRAHDVPAAVRSRLAALNRLDTELYEYAVPRFSGERIVAALRDSPQASPAIDYAAHVGGGIDDGSVGGLRLEVSGALTGAGPHHSGEAIKLTLTGTARSALRNAVIGFQLRDRAGVLYRLQTDWLGQRYRFAAGQPIEVYFGFENRLGAGDYAIDAYVLRDNPWFEDWALLALDAGKLIVLNGQIGARFEGRFALGAGVFSAHVPGGPVEPA